MASTAETDAMRRACDLAAAHLTGVSPNPSVGCVILDDAGAVAAEGWHAGPGTPHAEVVALQRAGARARGGTAVVTLEPCRHVGRTGPCTDALLGAGVRRIVYAVADPTADAGGGAQVLRAQGVDVECGLEAARAERVNEAWLHSVRRGRPFVTWKLGTSLDGRVAAADGSSQWITSVAARADAQALRAECDAILVGIGTVLADDPQLTARDPEGRPRGRQPLRVVLDTDGRVPAGARVLGTEAPTWVFVADDVAPRALGAAQVVPVPRGAGGLDLDAVLKALQARGVVHVLLEGGPRLAGAFAAAGLVQRLVVYVAPMLLGDGGRPMAEGLGVDSLQQALRLRLDETLRVGPDVRLTYRLAPA